MPESYRMAGLNKTKVFQVIADLSVRDRNRLARFLGSPYFNQNRELRELFSLIDQRLKDSKAVKILKKEIVWRRLCPGKPYDDARLRKYLSDLLRLVEEFLLQEQLQADPLRKANLLLEAVAKRNLTRLQNSSDRQVDLALERSPYRIPEYFLARFQAEKVRYELIDYETRREQRSNLEQISDQLDYFYLSEKLRILSIAASRKNIIDHDYRIGLAREIQQFVDREEFRAVPAISIYQQILLTYEHPEEEAHYFRLKKLLSLHSQQFPEKEAVETLYNAAQNYCIKKINAGQRDFLSELFSLFRDLLEKGFMQATGSMSPWYFRNIVVTGLRLGAYPWVERFIAKYEDSLPEEHRSNAVSFNRAQLYFYRKEFDKVIDLLQFIEYDDLTYNLNSKVTLLFTYYEINEIEPLFSLMDSFRKFLNRHKEIPSRRRSSYLELLKHTRRLAKATPGDTAAIQKLKAEIEAAPHVASQNWLLEKVEELF